MIKILKIFTVILALFAISCSKKLSDNPLIIPPNFNAMPDPNNPEQITPEQKSADVTKLKELLLKSD